MFRKILIPVVLVLFGLGFHSGPDHSFRIGFYNVENLFDTLDEPGKEDDDFTPQGRNEWNEERYQAKLESLSKVIAAMEFPAILGLCEVENGLVLKDLTAHSLLAEASYQFVHAESPDTRGIDNALIYNSNYFEVKESRVIRIDFPAEIVVDYTTRDILIVTGTFLGNHDITVIVNHWPSRRDGEIESEPKRLYVAQQIRDYLDELSWGKKEPLVFILGDFNDEPFNKSLSETLGAAGNKKEARKSGLFNFMWSFQEQGKGSYNFRGDWNTLDQIIVSSPLLKKRSGFRLGQAQIFSEEWMMFKHDKYGFTPNRTYGGPNYYGGFSDHLPVFLEFSLK